jgi:hypothetical protein
LLELFEQYAGLFDSWNIKVFEQENESYQLQINAVLTDGSRLELRDYLFLDNTRKYAYQWMNPDGSLRQRWDNAPHWHDISTTPHHVHLPGETKPQPSTITNLEDLLKYLLNWFQQNADK